jgi:hypothetical protein
MDTDFDFLPIPSGAGGLPLTARPNCFGGAHGMTRPAVGKFGFIRVYPCSSVVKK